MVRVVRAKVDIYFFSLHQKKIKHPGLILELALEHFLVTILDLEVIGLNVCFT